MEVDDPEIPKSPVDEDDTQAESPRFAPAALEEFEGRKFVRHNRWGPVVTMPFKPGRAPKMKIGQEFTHPTTGERWRVTDIGTRTFLAIEISDPKVVTDPSWANGPPYAIVEHVWDETAYGVLRDEPGIEWDDEV